MSHLSTAAHPRTDYLLALDQLWQPIELGDSFDQLLTTVQARHDALKTAHDARMNSGTLHVGRAKGQIIQLVIDCLPISRHMHRRR
jgi:hypothetical protein